MTSTSPSRAIVNLSAYAYNLRVVKRMIPEDCRVMAVVKADAYGHGAVRIAERAAAEGVAMLGVATVDEGIILRKAGISAPIVVLVQASAEGLGAAIEHDLRLTLSDVSAAERLGELARRENKVMPIHCKVDSGMSRQGFDLDRVVEDMRSLTRISYIDIEGIATHFPVANSSEDPFTASQIKAFRQLLKELDKEGIPYEIVHAANSAGIVNHPSSAFDMVRPGLMTYGVWPTDVVPETSPLRPVLRWETRVVLIKEIEPGATVGYGRTYTAPARMRTALLPVGYADGYKHGLSNRAHVLIGGRRCPVVGNVSMDQTVVDTTQVPEAKVGDTAVLIGQDGSEIVTVEELARHAQTIPYDILTGIGHRVERVYIE
ncbi:MAG: alanine racemase [Candidatus Hydrogenedentes bacterium]|nr:alanine racemase [Candidatus Hydrogenedentota bacterium]